MPFLPEDPNPSVLYRHPEGLTQIEMDSDRAYMLAQQQHHASSEAMAALILLAFAAFCIWLIARWIFVKRSALGDRAITAAAWSVRGARLLSRKAGRFRQRVIERADKQ